MFIILQNQPSVIPSTTFSTVFSKEYVRLKFALYTEVGENTLQIENHVKRMQALRKEINYVNNTDWNYEPIEKLIGQS